MSSARMLLAAVALGLAACAHTHNNDSLFRPDIRTAAPVLMIDAAIPPGYNDHVVILIDPQGIVRAARAGDLDPGIVQYSLSANPYRIRPGRPASALSSEPHHSVPITEIPAVSRPPRPRLSTLPRENSQRQGPGSHER